MSWLWLSCLLLFYCIIYFLITQFEKNFFWKSWQLEYKYFKYLLNSLAFMKKGLQHILFFHISFTIFCTLKQGQLSLFSRAWRWFSVVQKVINMIVITQKSMEHLIEWVTDKSKISNALTNFSPVSHFYTPLKTSENFWFSDVFKGYRNVILD